MAYIRKRFGKWQVNIRKKGYPGVYKAFHDVKTARRFIRDVESQMERGVFEDYSGARGVDQELMHYEPYEAIL
jgi:hypothetical protein